ncbi:hypothetical protein EYF80_045707 [Liparis tanakae]|uniref:Uncharacterized protein n=1 Tax=Liparis tanakae TaxID=230148 RepID=A0A4Z2FSV5_9TELE|nr:hypothetical protein EYF80_045707 [Liparis tanakae]
MYLYWWVYQWEGPQPTQCVLLETTRIETLCSRAAIFVRGWLPVSPRYRGEEEKNGVTRTAVICRLAEKECTSRIEMRSLQPIQPELVPGDRRLCSSEDSVFSRKGRRSGRASPRRRGRGAGDITQGSGSR